MVLGQSPYPAYGFPAAIISRAVRWYFRLNLSLRNLGAWLLERGVTVTYESIRRWFERFGPQFAGRVKARPVRARLDLAYR
jgi:putative transposase